MRARATGGSAAGHRKWCNFRLGRHLAVRQQERVSAMLSSAAVSWGAGRDLAMEPHSVGPVQLRFSPYAFNGG